MDNKDNIISKIIDAMEIVESFINKNGKEKEELAIKYLKDNLVDFDQYEDFIGITIDFIILVSKKKIKLDLNNIQKTKCCLSYR